MAHKLTSAKAKEMLRHGEAKGHPLTSKQKKFLGARAGGAPVKGLKDRKSGKKMGTKE